MYEWVMATCKWVMGRMDESLWRSHVLYVNESCLIYKWVMATCKWVMGQTDESLWRSHVLDVNESCRMYEWVMPHIQTSICFVTRVYMRHDSDMTQSCLTYKRVYVIYESWQHVNESWGKWMTHYVNESCSACEWVMSHIHTSHEWVSHYDLWVVGHGWHIMSHLICEWVMSYMWMSHVSYTNESCLIYEWVMSHIRMSHVSYTNESCLIYEW